MVPHHSTDCAITSLTSEIRRDPVLSSVYGRSCIISICTSTYTVNKWHGCRLDKCQAYCLQCHPAQPSPGRPQSWTTPRYVASWFGRLDLPIWQPSGRIPQVANQPSGLTLQFLVWQPSGWIPQVCNPQDGCSRLSSWQTLRLDHQILQVCQLSGLDPLSCLKEHYKSDDCGQPSVMMHQTKPSGFSSGFLSPRLSNNPQALISICPTPHRVYHIQYVQKLHQVPRQTSNPQVHSRKGRNVQKNKSMEQKLNLSRS